jgi:hypothetical protein
MQFLRSALPLAALSLLSGCAAVSGICRAGAHDCAGTGPPNGEVPNGTACAIVVQQQFYCTYDEEGRFKGQTTRSDGVCFCLNW